MQAPVVQCNEKLTTAVRKDLASAIRDLMQHGLMPVCKIKILLQYFLNLEFHFFAILPFLFINHMFSIYNQLYEKILFIECLLLYLNPHILINMLVFKNSKVF